jgi:alanyl-tRNA synthetase
MTGHEIKQAFLDYFKQKQHTIVPSSSLVPAGDPTLLFTNAGMVQFKDVFIGQASRPYTRAVSAQKCVRAGGKHNDLENVGRTARHHTFFEMLGNFSFGDYFKRQAIEFGWELLTQWLKLPPDRLWITIYKDDDEAGRIWQEEIGVPAERIVRFGEKDNFWSMGDIGPCGPCSEIIIDQGPALSCGRPDCKVGCECDRYLELWNLVFMQYERTADGELTPLPKPSIDTGMGLERITAVLQGKPSNFDTDLFSPIIERLEELSSVRYGESEERDVSLRVVADHLRAIAFLISDGVMPANEGRGYVLRRIIRRASRHGRKLGLLEPCLYRMTGVVADIMGDGYPELQERREFVARVTQNEEQRFAYTLEQGLQILEEMIEKAKDSKSSLISGKEVFKLYDTYGFPLDIAKEILEENALDFSKEEFDAAMMKQRERAKNAWKGMGPAYLTPAGQHQIVSIGLQPVPQKIYQEIDSAIGDTQFLGYDDLEIVARILYLVVNNETVKSAQKGEQVELVLDKTPFYAQKGGQVFDTGRIYGDLGQVKIKEVQLATKKVIVHKGIVETGEIKQNDDIRAIVDKERRSCIALNHTATHLLHAGLRQVLGDHVRQAGSLVAPDRLRFDFTHFSAVKVDELERIESLVNEYIRSNYPVMTQTLDLEEALQRGAVALFDEKYEERVRLVEIDGVSKELCGGTHTKATGDIGLFRVTAETSVAAGVRRIEALTGVAAYKYVARQGVSLQKVAQLLKASPAEVVPRLERLISTNRQQEKQIQELQQQLAGFQVDRLLACARQVEGTGVISARVDDMEMEHLRGLADLLRDKMGSGVITLGTVRDGRVLLVTMVSKDLTNKLHAGNIIRQVAKIVGGSGGGRPDMAQAGGKEPGKLPAALEEVYSVIKNMFEGG